jgi:hypothetical protein
VLRTLIFVPKTLRNLKENWPSTTNLMALILRLRLHDSRLTLAGATRSILSDSWSHDGSGEGSVRYYEPTPADLSGTRTAKASKDQAAEPR